MSSDTRARTPADRQNQATQEGAQADVSTARPRSADGVLTVEVADELLLYAAHKQTATSLNRSARAIWELCDGERTVCKIVDEIRRQLDCDNEYAFAQLRRDIESTIRELEHSGLLTLSG